MGAVPLPLGGDPEHSPARRDQPCVDPEDCAMSEHYEIHYTLQGEPHTDVIENLDIPIIDAVKELARKNNLAVNDDLVLEELVELAPVVGISDVSIQPLD